MDRRHVGGASGEEERSVRALLKPDIARHLGIVLLRPGSELMTIFSSGRVLVEPQPENMMHLPTGRVADARQPLAEDEGLYSFFCDERVINAAGGIGALEYWLERHGGGKCQWPHTEYHHHELVTQRHEPGALLLCWHCDNQLREQTTDTMAALARQNVARWIVDVARLSSGYDATRELSLSELCWWAVYAGVADAIPEDMARRALRLPGEPHQSVYNGHDLGPSVGGKEVLGNRLKKYRPAARQSAEPPAAKSVVNIQVDPESPESLMLRPKRRRWVNEKYTRWAKAQLCVCCGKPADDPHHLIGYGQGGMGTKAHDLFVIPLCRAHHDELHADQAAFEAKYGSQPELALKTIDRALAFGVLA